MGNYFTSLLIHNKDRLSQSSFLKLFKSEMKKNGYEVCNEDSAELSYTIKYGINWATVYSETYVPGGSDVRNDAAQFAKMLETFCLNTAVIDSDCAVIDLYGKDGNKMDMIIMGRADDYFGSDIPEPSEEIWKPFLADGYTWEQLYSIRNGDYVFVEEGLELLAKTLEIDVENIMFTGEESDKNTVCLSFRTAEAKKTKKLTLKTAFVKVFGEALELLGFVKIKSKHPYYVRVISDDILHVITILKDNYYKNRFDVYAGIATIYRPMLDFDQDPDFNTKWMSPIRAFEDYKVDSPVLGIYYEYDMNSQTALIHTLTKALKHTQEYVLPVLDTVSDLQKVIEFYTIYNSAALYIYSAKDMSEYNRDDNEGFLHILINDHSDMRSEFEKCLERDKYLTENGISNFDFNRLREAAEESRKEIIMNRDAIYNDKDLYENVMQELSRNKASNIKKLQSYGLSIDEI